MILDRDREMGPGEMFMSFKDAPSYERARKIAPGAAIIARTFGGYIAFSSIELYHLWMRDR